MDVEEVSIGDYVLAGGEVAVLVMVEAVARLLPGVLGNAESAVDDSFAEGRMESLLEGPVYTRPPSWRGLDVPAGAAVRRPRRRSRAGGTTRRCARTRDRRPDLLGEAEGSGARLVSNGPDVAQ